MPRSNRPRGRRGARRSGRPAGPRPLQVSGTEEVEFAGQLWTVRQVRGTDSGRRFRCPGCQQELTAALAHTVVWPTEGMQGLENRRHWHTACWNARGTRPPGGSWA